MKAVEISVQSREGHLTRGEATKLTIRLDVRKPVKIRGIHAAFVGGTETKATYTTYNAATKSNQVHTTVQLEEVVKREFLLSGNEQLGFFGNMADGLSSLFGGGDHEELAPGQYDFEVEVELPPDAPGTFSGKNSRVYYEFTVLVDVPMGRDFKEVISFTVPLFAREYHSEPVMTRYPEDIKKGLLDCLFAPDVKIEAALTENHFQRGADIVGVFQIESDKPLECRSISARLFAIEKSEANKHHDTVHHLGPLHRVSDSGVIDGVFRQDFSMPAEVSGPGTTVGPRHSVQWFVQIEIDVPWAKDPKIRVPVVILD